MELNSFDHCEDLSLVADVKKNGDVLEFSYLLAGNVGDVAIPPSLPPVRTDGLWNSTCFEAFISTGKTSYLELNFAPSGQWAAYSFTAYRCGMRELDIAQPKISFAENRLAAAVELAARPGSALNLTAVIERKNGISSYWALAHPAGNRPDFHARDCFVSKLP
ncbi:MAG TPA: DOMON-like domain-containing protein [Sphingomicrobium sp.]|jgi:hypothetical protein|nr:DOMON-like domain-containing protein [Sphingomicrobium sp.]